MYSKFFVLLVSISVLLLTNPLSIKAEEFTKTDTRGIISVTGTASENLSPDTAVIVLSVETIAKTAQDAAVNNSRKADKVVSQMKQLIKPDLGDTIKTSSYRLQPVYEYDNSRKKNVLTGYSASNQLTITTAQIKCVGDILDNAVSSGANQVQSINFQLKKNDYCKRLLMKASENAKEQASVIAQSLGVKISGIKQANGSCGTEQTYPRMYSSAKAIFDESAAPSTPVEAGEIKVNSTVSVDFYAN